MRRTVETGSAHYHSRSRDELWETGKSSGHAQDVTEVRPDCDGGPGGDRDAEDGVALRVEREGERAFDPDDAYE